jgi:Tetratricopeptide repeat
MYLRILLFLLAALGAAAAPARAEWLRAETRHFVIYGDAGADELRGYARELEGIDAVLRAVTGATGEGGGKLSLYVLDDVAAIRRLVDMPAFARAFYAKNPLEHVAVIGRRDAEADDYDWRWPTFHEYAHHFMMEHMSQLQPMWFVEGFASVFESARTIGPGTVRIGEMPRSRENTLSFRRWLDTRHVLAGVPDNPDPEVNLQFYAQGWLLAHHYYFGGGRSAELDAYLKIVQAGGSLPELDGLFNGGIAGLDADMQTYLARRPLASRDVAVAPITDADIRIEPLPPGQRELIETRIRATGIDGYESLDAILAAALPVARKYPGDREVAEFVAWLAFFAADYAAAGELLEPLMASAGDRPRTLALKGHLVTRKALDEAEAEQFAPMIREGRSYIERALKLAPDDPLVLEAMFDNHESDFGPTPKAAFAFLKRAVASDPGDARLRFQLVDHLIRAGDFAEAAEVVQPLANAPHPSAEKSKARAYVRAIEEKIGTKG